MLTHIRLENFKSWRELDIDLAPITLLFGTNSSGKSSVLQALLLLVQSIEKLSGYSINFGGSVHDYTNLGSYRDVVFGHDLSKEVAIRLQWFEGWYETLPNSDMKLQVRYENDDVQSNLEEIYFHLADFFISSQKLHYLRPLRQYPQRTYLWTGAAPDKIEPDGENTIAALVASVRHGGELLRQVSNWLVRAGLVDKFRVASIDQDNRFYESKVDIAGIESALLDSGFGISQVLPVITMLYFVPEDATVLLEQPELHLHPSAQAHLADLFLEVAETRKLQLIVESHSEHLLRRLQRRIAEAESPFATPDNIKMYFCQPGKNGSTIQPVEVDEFGQIRNWPDNFFGDITGDLEKMAMAALQRAHNGG